MGRVLNSHSSSKICYWYYYWSNRWVAFINVIALSIQGLASPDSVSQPLSPLWTTSFRSSSWKVLPSSLQGTKSSIHVLLRMGTLSKQNGNILDVFFWLKHFVHYLVLVFPDKPIFYTSIRENWVGLTQNISIQK